ncbi:bioflim formation protein [Meiothermus sp.]|uniref:bioflim formation protein n=1 Tax=Meiothermus sp. TaxID=1955249 RepID=UPI00307E6581
MKRLFALLTLVVGLAFAQAPAYPENTVGVGFGIGRGLMVQGSLGLPFSPLGIDTGLDMEVLVPTSFDSVEVWALLKANLLPALTVADLSLSAGLGIDLSFNTVGSIFGFHLGPVASLEIPGGAISGYVGLGIEGGFNVAYGLGGRLYLDPIALEVGLSDRYPFKIALLYLW